MKKSRAILVLVGLLSSQCGCLGSMESNVAAFHLAVAKDDIDTVKLLAGRYPKIVDEVKVPFDGNRPIHVAAECGTTRTAQFLLDHGVDINATNARRDTPLHLACREGQIEFVKFCIDRGSQLDAENDGGKAPLQEACYQGRREIVKLLLQNGVDVNRSFGNAPPIICAVIGGDSQTVQALLAAGADVQAKDCWGATAMDIAIGDDRPDLVEMLRNREVHK